jgi:hypothetical protein
MMASMANYEETETMSCVNDTCTWEEDLKEERWRCMHHLHRHKLVAEVGGEIFLT